MPAHIVIRCDAKGIPKRNALTALDELHAAVKRKAQRTVSTQLSSFKEYRETAKVRREANATKIQDGIQAFVQEEWAAVSKLVEDTAKAVNKE